MKIARAVLLLATLAPLLASLSIAAAPSGWIYFSWPYGYAWPEEAWHFFNPPASGLWLLGLADLQWRPFNAALNGWHYLAWPYAYRLDTAAWSYCSPERGVWTMNLAGQQWSELGQIDLNGYWLTRYAYTNTTGTGNGVFRVVDQGNTLLIGRTAYDEGTRNGNSFHMETADGGYLDGTVAADGITVTGEFREKVAGTWRYGRWTARRAAAPGRYCVTGLLAGASVDWCGDGVAYYRDVKDSTYYKDMVYLCHYEPGAAVVLDLWPAQNVGVGTTLVSVVSTFPLHGGFEYTNGPVSFEDHRPAGNIKVDRLDAWFTGTFALSFSNGQHVSGSFDVPYYRPADLPAP